MNWNIPDESKKSTKGNPNCSGSCKGHVPHYFVQPQWNEHDKRTGCQGSAGFHEHLVQFHPRFMLLRKAHVEKKARDHVREAWDDIAPYEYRLLIQHLEGVCQRCNFFLRKCGSDIF